MLLGFQSDAMGMNGKETIFKRVLNSYQHRFGMTDNGYNGNNMNGIGINGMAQQPKSPDIETPAGFDDIASNDNGVNGVDGNKNDILTLEQIILWSTHENMQDNDTMETLIMTHKMFTDSLTLLKQLRKRFLASKNDLIIKEFQLKVIKVYN